MQSRRRNCLRDNHSDNFGRCAERMSAYNCRGRNMAHIIVFCFVFIARKVSSCNICIRKQNNNASIVSVVWCVVRLYYYTKYYIPCIYLFCAYLIIPCVPGRTCTARVAVAAAAATANCLANIGVRRTTRECCLCGLGRAHTRKNSAQCARQNGAVVVCLGFGV